MVLKIKLDPESFHLMAGRKDFSMEIKARHTICLYEKRKGIYVRKIKYKHDESKTINEETQTGKKALF